MSDNRFIILITVYNAIKYIDDCIRSAMNQKYDNYQIIIIDDCSNDGTSEHCLECESNKVLYHRNAIRMGDSLPNTVLALGCYNVGKDDIVVHLDGDDCLAHDNVLNVLNKAYNEDIWITYGQYEPMSHNYHNYCTPILDHRTYRQSGVWRTSHLKTWKKWLWDEIKDEDLRDKNGGYFKAATDNAFMYPMLEMAGAKHTKFIAEVLYMYNDLNPVNYMKERANELIETSAYIRRLPLYDEL